MDRPARPGARGRARRVACGLLGPGRFLLIAVAALALFLRPAAAFAAPPVKPQQVSSDPFTNSTSQHQTEVEADDASFGNTIVSAFQAGRFVSGGGSSDIGFAASTDAGLTWSSGFLPSLTIFSSPPGPYGRATDPTVAYDARHGQWLIATESCDQDPGTCFTGTAITISRSSDGLTWGPPVVVASGLQDHGWIACDNGSANLYYGRCYVSWANLSGGGVATSSSDDGGQTWTPRTSSTGLFAPSSTVASDGRLVVVGISGGSYTANSSTDGASTFTSATISPVVGVHATTGMRVTTAAVVEADGGGSLYVTWNDCRFRAGCSANDVVLSTSTNGVAWSPVSRVPIDDVGSGVDHFIPGLGADRTTSGSSAHIAATYYYFPDAGCALDHCRLKVGYISSSDGGTTWAAPVRLYQHSMRLSWLANTSFGGSGPAHMVGDYMSTAFAGGKAVTVFAVASKPSHAGPLDEHMVAAAV